MDNEDEERRLWFRRAVLPIEKQLRAHALRWSHGCPGDADDLVHDTFTRLIVCPGWRDIENVSAFAISTMRNIVLQAARRRKIVSIHAMSDIETLPICDDRPGSDRIVEGQEQWAALLAVIEALPPQCRRVFKMRKFEDLSYAQIADRLGLSISTIEKHLIKGLRLCSQGLAKGMATEHRGDHGPGRDTAARADQRGRGGVGDPARRSARSG